MIKQIFQSLHLHNLGPTLPKVISNVFQGKPYYYFRAQLFYSYDTKIK